MQNLRCQKYFSLIVTSSWLVEFTVKSVSCDQPVASKVDKVYRSMKQQVVLVGF